MAQSFQKALDLWSQVNLPLLQHQLDSSAEEVTTLQSQSIESRKSLASHTKQFKKLDDQEQLKEIKPLLKQYQNEIDSLTSRSKFAESEFFKVYESIAELPDPKPLLEASIDSIIALNDLEAVKKENQELNLKLLKYADYDQLKSKLSRLEASKEAELNNLSKLKENETSTKIHELKLQWDEEKMSYIEKINDLEKSVIDYKANEKILKLKLKNQIDVLDQDNDEDGEESIKETHTDDDNHTSTEVIKLKNENETNHKKINQLSKRNDELIKEISTLKTQLNSNDLKLSKELKLNELESENITLINQLEYYKKTSQTLENSNSITIKKLNNEISQLKSTLSNNESKLVKYKDYDELKREVLTLRTISFGKDLDFDENEDDEDDSNQRDDDNNNKNSDSNLDEILIKRNKKLTNDITHLRSDKQTLEQTITELQSKIQSLTTELSQAKNLNHQLESDLTNFQPKLDTMSLISSIKPKTKRSLSPASSIANGLIGSDQFEDSSASNSVLPIITSQRDRFRQRNIELEQLLTKNSNIIKDLKTKINSLTNDNNELYSQIKYLQSFQKGRSSNGYDKDLESNYSNQYEESLHPLQKFKKIEQERISSKLSPLERIFLSFAKAILANKTSRLLFLGYCVGLHCLVMAMTVYVMSLHGSLTPEVGIVDKSEQSIA